MSLCSCPERPKCEYHHCRAPADWSVRTPPGRWIKTRPYGRLHFMCTPCRDYYVDALSKPLKGIDRPEGADDDWKPSLMEHIRHAQIAMAFKARKSQPAPATYFPDDNYWRDYMTKRGFTPAQRAQSAVHRELARKYFRADVGVGNG